jgi:hypothetical protein
MASFYTRQFVTPLDTLDTMDGVGLAVAFFNSTLICPIAKSE